MERVASRPAGAAELAAALRRDGYGVARGLAPVGEIGALAAELAPRFERTPFARGAFSGSGTKRFHGLLKRSKGAAALVMQPTMLRVAEEILRPFCDTLQLNLTQAIEVHPGCPAQIPHRDQDMWGGEKGRTEYLLNVMWPLTAFERANGGTLLWPGSHGRQEDRHLAEAAAVCPDLLPGDALLFLGSTLHGAGANRTALSRRGIIVSYCLGWLKPYENMWLTYPPEVARAFPPALRDLIGYRRHRPNLGNYDGQCPSILFEGEPEDHPGVVDELAPGQEERIAAWSAGRG
jgi:ectoine hydroxylase-related dioxygenase (phytanoyl-CoA dioxygenase family)